MAEGGSIRAWIANGLAMWQTGGRVTTQPNPDGTTHVNVSGGRYARRLDEHQATLICGECHAEADIERGDSRPLSDADIAEALTVGLIHDFAAAARPSRKAWNQCTECDRYAPCRHHPDADIVGPIPEDEMDAGNLWFDEEKP